MKFYTDNIGRIGSYFSNNLILSFEKYIPSFLLTKLELSMSDEEVNAAVKSIEEKIKRDWLYHVSFMKIVDVVSNLGTCSRRKVGAVLVRNRRILATGFNGTPPGTPHCNDEICPGKLSKSGSDLSLCAAVHAEENCLIYCAKYGVSASESTLYVSCEPCDDCMKLVETVGIENVIYQLPYPSKMSSLRKYYKCKAISINDLLNHYRDLCKGRVIFEPYNQIN